MNKSLKSGLVLASFCALYVAVSEALHLTLRSPYFLGDLGAKGLLATIALYATFAIVAGSVTGVLVRTARNQAFVLAALAYTAVSLKVLWLDAEVLAIPAVGGAFIVISICIAIATVQLSRRFALSDSFPLLVTAAHVNACLGVATGWALAGGKLWPFLHSKRTLLVVATTACLLLITTIAQRVFERRHAWWSRHSVHALTLAAIVVGITTASRHIAGRSSHSTPTTAEADIYVLSFDALRPDVLREYAATHPEGALARTLTTGSVFSNVVAHGSSTDHILTNNTFAGTLRTQCAGTLPAELAGHGYFTAMLYAGVGRRFEGSVCYEYYFAGEGQDLSHRFTVPGLVDVVMHPNRVRRKVLRAAPLLAKIGDLAQAAPPLLVYAHFLELHAPYAPHGRGSAAVDDYMRRCYTTACDPVENAVVIGAARRAYLDTLDEVDEAVARARQIAESRKRPFIIVITADHGELFGEHGGFAHGGGFVPELLHIPFVVYDSRHPVPSKRCELMLSSEAMRATLLGTPYPDHPTLDVTLPLGHMVIDKAAGTLRYEIAPDAIPHAGTWRNIHRDAAGTLPYPIEQCP